MTSGTKHVHVDALSLRAFPISMWTTSDALIADATAFLYRYGRKVFLLTNWHNLTGLHPDSNRRLDVTSPAYLTFPYGESGERGVRWKDVKLELYAAAGTPQWFVHPEHGHSVDVAAIEILSGGDCEKAMCINDLEYDELQPQIADSIYILGFPFRKKVNRHLPIWKRASIASEPGIDIDNLPKMYVDSATRRGMSGSPVILRRVGIHNLNVDGTPNGESTIGEAQAFAGMYSGRIVEGDDTFAAQLGIIWKPSVIEEIIIGKHRESTYFPNESFPG